MVREDSFVLKRFIEVEICCPIFSCGPGSVFGIRIHKDAEYLPII